MAGFRLSPYQIAMAKGPGLEEARFEEWSAWILCCKRGRLIKGLLFSGRREVKTVVFEGSFELHPDAAGGILRMPVIPDVTWRMWLSTNNPKKDRPILDQVAGSRGAVPAGGEGHLPRVRGGGVF